MNLVKTQTLYIHSSRREFNQGQHRSFVLSSLQVGNLNEVLRRRRIVTRSVIEGRETRAKKPAYHGKGMKKKSSTEQQSLKEKTCENDPNGMLTSSSLAPADFCNVEEALDELDDDDELHIFRALVLDLSYSIVDLVAGSSMGEMTTESCNGWWDRPINVVNWKRALCLEVMEKADVLTYYDQTILATTRTYYLPAVLRVSGFVHSPKSKKIRLNLNRNNIFLRDKFRCQYCNKREDLTIDHVLAASRGGGWEWENLVTACASCNVKKGDKSLEECRMKLLKLPREPKELDSMDLPPNYRTFRILHRNNSTPAEWLDYLPNRPFHL